MGRVRGQGQSSGLGRPYEQVSKSERKFLEDYREARGQMRAVGAIDVIRLLLACLLAGRLLLGSVLYEYVCTVMTNLLRAKYTSSFHWGPRLARLFYYASKQQSGMSCLDVLRGRVLSSGHGRRKGHPLVEEVVQEGGFNIPIRAPFVFSTQYPLLVHPPSRAYRNSPTPASILTFRE